MSTPPSFLSFGCYCLHTVLEADGACWKPQTVIPTPKLCECPHVASIFLRVRETEAERAAERQCLLDNTTRCLCFGYRRAWTLGPFG
jgi:hypothetical protein